MGRWEPNALERLQQAAMDLFHERGYDRTTVEEIAARAGLTERTFFRYFTDKREVLFSGSHELAKLILDAMASTPATTTPLDTVVAGLEAADAMFDDDRRPHARKRQALIVAHAELHEREVMKLASCATVIAKSLHARGVPDPVARLVAETGAAIFKNAFERWLEDGKQRGFAVHVRATLADLRRATAAGDSPPEKSVGPRRRGSPATG